MAKDFRKPFRPSPQGNLIRILGGRAPAPRQPRQSLPSRQATSCCVSHGACELYRSTTGLAFPNGARHLASYHGMMRSCTQRRNHDHRRKDVGGENYPAHAFDLADWRENLKKPFDPWVLYEGDEFFLLASEFGSCKSVEEVRDSAILLIDLMNGAMRAATQAGPISCGDVVYELFSDGRVRRHIIASVGAARLRMKGRAPAVIISRDGTPVPPPAAQSEQGPSVGRTK